MDEPRESIVATLYDPDTGALLGVRTGQRYAIERDEFPHVLGSHDFRTHYIDTCQVPPRVIKRPTQTVELSKGSISANGKDALILSGLPAPCVIQVGEHRYEVEDGELEWSTFMPGTYHIHVEAFPYLDWESEVTAIASGASPDEG